MPETYGKTAEARPRKFVFNGMQLADPDPGMTPQKVAEFHSLLHAEALVNRYNLGFALNWEAHPERYRFTRIFDVLIACAVWIPESHGKKSFRRSRKRTVHTSLTEAFSPPAGKSSSAMAVRSFRIPTWNCRL